MTATERALTLTRTLDAPRAAVWRCWIEPELLRRWFCPLPWTVSEARIDLRPGGEFFVRMRGPAGEDVPNSGVWLEVVPGERLVFTDAFVREWESSAKAFLTGTVVFSDAGPGQTALSGFRSALDGGGPQGARGDGLPRGLGQSCRPAGGAGTDAVAGLRAQAKRCPSCSVAGSRDLVVGLFPFADPVRDFRATHEAGAKVARTGVADCVDEQRVDPVAGSAKHLAYAPALNLKRLR